MFANIFWDPSFLTMFPKTAPFHRPLLYFFLVEEPINISLDPGIKAQTSFSTVALANTGTKRQSSTAFHIFNQTSSSQEAGKLLVEYYTVLRQRDGGAGGGGAWRITVRQLESMVRLAEAMAKMHCSGHVTPQHVHEAYRCGYINIIIISWDNLQMTI